MASTSRTVRVIFTGITTGLSNAAKKAERDLEGVRKKVDTVSSGLATVGKVVLFAGAIGSAIALVAALRPVQGVLLALPAAAGLGISAFAALKVGTAGVGDALKALASGDAKAAAEALAKLSPSARAAVLAIDGVRTSYKGLQQATQQALFAGLGPQITALGQQYLPILQRGLVANAGALNAWAQSGIAAARSPFVSGAVNDIMAQSAAIMQRSSPIAGHLVTMFAALARGGMPLVDTAMRMATSFAESGAAFLSSAEGADWMRQKVELAQQVLAKLGALASNIGQLVAGVFTAAQGPGMGLLDTLVKLTAQAAVWAQSMEGQQQLTALFSVLTQVFTNMLPIIGLISGAVLTLTSFIASLPAPVQTVITSLGSWLLVVGLLAPKLMGIVTAVRFVGVALAPLAGSLIMAAARMGMLGTAAAVASVQTGATALSVIRVWLLMATTATTSALRAAGAWVIATGTSAATAVATMVTTVATIIGQWVLLAATAVANAARAALAWTIGIVVPAAQAFASMVATAVAVVAQWAMMAAGAMARAAMMAAAWLVAMGPVGWVTAAVIGLVALIIANWDKVKAGTSAAWNAVSTAVRVAWAAISAVVSGAVGAVTGFVSRCWSGAVSLTTGAWRSLTGAVSSGISTVLGFVGSLPGRILSALGRLGSLLLGAGRDLVDGLWRGIQAGWSWLTNAVSNLARTLLDAAKRALGIASPSKAFRDQIGQWVPKGMAIGITANTGAVRAAAEQLARTAVTAAAPVVDASRSGVALSTGTQTMIDALRRRDAAPTYVTVKIGERELDAIVDTRVEEKHRDIRRSVGV